MLIEYQFKINGTLIHPLYGDGFTKDYEKESNEQYFRVRLNGSMKLINADFDLINTAAFTTKFEIVLYSKYNNTGIFDPEWYGYFYKTDCKFDLDNKTVEIKLNIDDAYSDVLSGIEKTYDLLKLATPKTKVFIDKRPLIQVYIPNDTTISCFLSGNAWEQDVLTPISDVGALVSTYKFGLASTITDIQVTQGEGGSTPTDVLGSYVGEGVVEWFNSTAYKIVKASYNNYSTVALSHDKTSADIGSLWTDPSSHNWILVAIDGTTLKFMPYFSSYVLASSVTLTHHSGAAHTTSIVCGTSASIGTFYTFAIVRVSDGLISFYAKEAYLVSFDTGNIPMVHDGVNNISTGTVNANKAKVDVYMRYLLDVDYIQGTATSNIPANDLVDDNRNYKKCIDYPIDLITLSTNLTTTPTEYGINDAGLYYNEPAFGSPLYGKYYPIGKSQWGAFSIWFKFDDFDIYYETDGRKPYEFKEGILLSDAISILLDQIAPSINHAGSSSYSQFLYGTTNPIAGGAFRVMISQKSNITAGEFDKPAQKAEITLMSILEMLKSVYQCYWYIDGTSLKIEHISFFKNGGAYTGTPLLNADLTTLYDAKSKKAWGFSSSKYEYAKETLPDRYEFSWADESTLAFDGYPIQIVSRFIQEGLVESITTGEFTADIDYMLLNPSAINQDGFALMAARIGANLFNIAATHNLGYYVDYLDGTLHSHVGYNTTGFIGVKENTNYIFKTGTMCAWYDYDQVFISGWNNYYDPEIVQLAPSGACYVRVGVLIANWTAFKLMKGNNENGTYEVAYIAQTVDRADLYIQNGLLSRIYLNYNYWVHDLPSEDVLINNEVGVVRGVKRNKVQEVSYPSDYDPNPLKLIKTYLGNGQIEKISVNLASRMNKITLRYDTE